MYNIDIKFSADQLQQGGAAALGFTHIDISRFPRWLTTFSSEGLFKFPMALVIRASQERRSPLQLCGSFKNQYFSYIKRSISISKTYLR